MIHHKEPSVLVTGAQGFVGNYLCRHLLETGYRVRAAVRRSNGTLKETNRLEIFETGELTHFVDWRNLLLGIDAVVHLIARTHITDEFGASAMSEYRRINVDLSRRLAKACVRERVSQFIYMSSIKAVGNGGSEVYSETTECQPEDSYGITKLEAEKELAAVLGNTGCRLTVLRPPLIYGPGVGGNFLRLIRLVERGVPLPGVSNARSMVHVENLVDATVRCLVAETEGDNGDRADTNLFHVADQDPISTTNLVRQIGIGLGKAAIVVPVPKRVLSGLGQFTGKTEEVKRLIGSLTVSTEKIERELNWTQRFKIADGVAATCRSYRQQPWSVEPKTAGDSAETRRVA